jgi:hypothetical protein
MITKHAKMAEYIYFYVDNEAAMAESNIFLMFTIRTSQ